MAGRCACDPGPAEALPGRPEVLGPFARALDGALAFAGAAKAAGRPVVGIACEYAPRELILAAGGVPVCLCGGSEDTARLAERELPVNLCPLVKSTYGYHLERSNPFLEMADLLVAETTCDARKKMYELMARSRPVHVMELPQKPDSPAAAALWLEEVRGLKRVLDRRFRRITDRRLRDAVLLMNRERGLRRRIAAAQRSSPPPLTGRESLELRGPIAAIPADLDWLADLAARLERGAIDPPPGAEGRPRVLLTGVPVLRGAEKVLEIVEEKGGVVVAQENCTGLKPVLEDVDPDAPDLLAAVAAKYLRLPCSVMTPNKARLDLLARLIREYRPDCVLELTWQNCLTYAVESVLVREVAERAGLPYLRLETDYSPSDRPSLGLRVQALLEVAAGRRRRPGRPRR